MNKNRRSFLKDIVMASSAIGALGKAHAETEIAVDFKRIAAGELDRFYLGLRRWVRWRGYLCMALQQVAEEKISLADSRF